MVDAIINNHTSLRPGDRVTVCPKERGPYGRWWTVQWYPCEGGDDIDTMYADFVYSDEVLTLSDGHTARPLVNRKAGGYESAVVPEGPFTIRRVRQPETWVDALVRLHRQLLWHPQMSVAPKMLRAERELDDHGVFNYDERRAALATHALDFDRPPPNVRPRPAMVTLCEAPLDTEYGASWFVQIP